MGHRRILPFPSDRRNVDQIIHEWDDPIPIGPNIDLDPLSGPMNDGVNTKDAEISPEDAIDDAIDRLKKLKRNL